MLHEEQYVILMLSTVYKLALVLLIISCSRLHSFHAAAVSSELEMRTALGQVSWGVKRQYIILWWTCF